MRPIHLAAAALLLLAAASPLAARLRIAIVGDSFASGEGNPDRPATCRPGIPPEPLVVCSRAFWAGRSGRPATQSDAVCHRSTASGLLRAAEQLRADLAGVEDVIIETYACSGAKTGTVGRSTDTAFSDDEGLGRIVVPAQLQALQNDPAFRDPETGNRIDAIIMAIGANNIHFSTIVAHCGSPEPCDRTLDVDGMIATLPDRYNELRSDMDSLLPGRIGNVFIMQYHNPVVGPDGPCGAGFDIENPDDGIHLTNPEDMPWLIFIARSETRWVTQRLVPHLNAAVRDAATAHGWHFVPGAEAAFQRHGYCGDENQRWVRNLADMAVLQRQPWGVLHPNRRGHDALRDLVRPMLQPYVERLAAPAQVKVVPARQGGDAVALTGGAGGTTIQTAFFEIADARPGAVLPRPSGFPGDGVRQRVTNAGGQLTLQPMLSTGRPWRLVELGVGSPLPTAADRHFAVAARRCNTLRCSGWGPLTVMPAVLPDGATFLRLPDRRLVPTWLGHRRDGVYQVAVPAAGNRWDVFRVDGRGRTTHNVIGLTPTSFVSGRVVSADRLANPPVMTDDASVRTSEYFVRGCNQAGCSAWASAAVYVNALRVPAPGGFGTDEGADGCRRASGTLACPAAVRMRSAWARVPGASAYQVALFPAAGTPETLTQTTTAVTIDSRMVRGLRVRACNAAGCSNWSPAQMLPGTAGRPAPNLDPPRIDDYTVAATRPPPAGLPLP